MDYEEAVEYMVSAAGAKLEIEKHGARFEDFAAEFGWRAEYSGKDVLDWLGY